MANKSRFIIAESSIKSFFTKGPKKVFSREEIKEIFEERRGIWNLPLSTYPDKFIEQLLQRGILKKQVIEFESFVGKKERFISDEATPYQVAVSLFNKSYISHYTAVFLNGLTTQVPKRIYSTFEQSKKINTNRTLEQAAIDAAFSKPQRKAISKVIYEDYEIIILNGMNTNRAGVTTIENVPVTGLERTLIDITVRPLYAGGVDAVLEAYKRAMDSISINKLIAILDAMNFIYPYHQAIGFYMERAGYESKKLTLLKEKKKNRRFYLTYEMGQKAYSEDWMIYYPKGM
ncbi:MAG: hypothetical protein JWN76_1580 [Chitinophagaceae bacterium]|nr:hypothetical protein [Chitinophagaceae bacterium]